jgi:hypothetical protein
MAISFHYKKMPDKSKGGWIGSSRDTGVRSEQKSGGFRSPARWSSSCKDQHVGELSHNAFHVNLEFLGE